MRDQERAPKITEVFHRPNPYDLIKVTATFDGRDIEFPPKTYFPSSNPEEQITNITETLKNAFANHLLFVGLTGSRTENRHKQNTDVDIFAIVDNDAGAKGIVFEGDLKIVSLSGLKTFIEHGYQLVTTQFRKAIPLYESQEASLLEPLRKLKPIPKIAIPFLIKKSKFNEQTADIFRLASSKYRAIYFCSEGFEVEAFAQLKGFNQDILFQNLQEDTAYLESNNLNASLARYYSYLGLNRMFHSISEMLQALHIKENKDVADVEELVCWSLQRLSQIGSLFEHIYQKRVACYKKGELLLDLEYDYMRGRISEANQIVEKMVGH